MIPYPFADDIVAVVVVVTTDTLTASKAPTARDDVSVNKTPNNKYKHGITEKIL